MSPLRGSSSGMFPSSDFPVQVLHTVLRRTPELYPSEVWPRRELNRVMSTLPAHTKIRIDPSESTLHGNLNTTVCSVISGLHLVDCQPKQKGAVSLPQEMAVRERQNVNAG